MNVLADTQAKAEKTSVELGRNKELLEKLTAKALNPALRKLDSTMYTQNLFAAIGKTSINVMLLEDLYAHQKHNIKAIKRNEFFTCPLVAIIKIVKLITGRKP